jgi:hypothetical protein
MGRGGGFLVAICDQSTPLLTKRTVCVEARPRKHLRAEFRDYDKIHACPATV